MIDELINLFKPEGICSICKRERKAYFFEKEKVSMCLSCYSKKVFKELDPIEIEYSEFALNTGGKPYKLNKNRKWLRTFYKDVLWNGKD
jgi:hypothetical protein